MTPRRAPVMETLEPRRLLAAAPLLVDFGTTTGGPAGQQPGVITPAHEDGGLAGAVDWYNNIGAVNVATGGLVYGNGAQASGVSLTWGRATTTGGAINWGDASNIAASFTGTNSANREFDSPLLRDIVASTSSGTQEQALRIAGLEPGTYVVYFVNSRRGFDKTFTNQIGVNLAYYDPQQAQFQGGMVVDGQFSPSGEYSRQIVTLDANDTLDVIVHGHTWDDGSRASAFNLLEIVPITAVPLATAPVAQPQVGVHNGAGVPSAVDAWGSWSGNDVLWDIDYVDQTNWTEIERLWVATQTDQWKAQVPGRRLSVAIPLVPTGGTIPDSSTDPTRADDNNAHFITIAEKLIAMGHNDAIIRLGWEFNGNWYSWQAGTTAKSQGNWVRNFREVVNAIRSVDPQNGNANNLLIEWNPALGDNTTSGNLMDPLLVYPGDQYVDIIGLDVYDEWTGYSNPPTAVQQERLANELMNQSSGLLEWARFAREHNKPLSIPEWGVRNPNPGGGDNAYFITMMHGFVANPDNNVLYQSYFNYRGAAGTDWALFPGTSGAYQTNYPKAAAEYLRKWGRVHTAVGSDVNIGVTPSVGWAAYNPADASWTLASNGTGIGSGADQYRFAANSVSGDQTLITRIGAMSAGTTGAKAGLVMRDSLFASGNFVGLFRTPTGIVLQHRSGNGSVSTINGPSTTAPVWLKLVRSGDVFTAYYATTAATPLNSDWRVITAVTPTFATNYYAGLAAASGSAGQSNVVKFTAFSVRPNAEPSANTWSTTSIGAVPTRGSASFGHGSRIMSLSSSGTIWNTADSFQYVSTGATGSSTIIARIDSLTQIQNNTNTGLMFRDSFAADSRMVFLLVRQDGGLRFAGRLGNGSAVQNFASDDTAMPAPSTPLWLKLVKSGNSYTAFFAAGVATPGGASTAPPGTWTQIGGAQTVTFANSTFRAGLASESAGKTALNYVTFGYVDVTGAVATAPLLNGWRINEGSSQRSSIRSLSLSFDQQVTLSAGAVTLTRAGGSAVTLTILNPSLDKRTYLLTFSGSGTSAGGLIDGNYTLNLTASLIKNAAGQALSGGNRSFSFHRYFGDSDGDRDVDSLDAMRFRLSANQTTAATAYNAAFDADGDGDVDSLDAMKFRLNSNKKLP